MEIEKKWKKWNSTISAPEPDGASYDIYMGNENKNNKSTEVMLHRKLEYGGRKIGELEKSGDIEECLSIKVDVYTGWLDGNEPPERWCVAGEGSPCRIKLKYTYFFKKGEIKHSICFHLEFYAYNRVHQIYIYPVDYHGSFLDSCLYIDNKKVFDENERMSELDKKGVKWEYKWNERPEYGPDRYFRLSDLIDPHFIIGETQRIAEDIYYTQFLGSSENNCTNRIIAFCNVNNLTGNTADQLIGDYVYYIQNKEKSKEETYIPSYAILGPAGVGKTKLAKELAKIFERELEIVTPGSLKAQYIGQTQDKVFELLKRNDEREKPKIILIDEAYVIANDVFGKEAITELLPIISMDRKELIKEVKNENGHIIKREPYKLKEWPIIWLAGYEQEMHDAVFSVNPGLERRMSKICLETPGIEALYNVIKEKIDKDLLDKLGNPEIEIKEFLNWATASEHSRFFANYSGAEGFAEYLNKQFAAYKMDCESGKKEYQFLLEKTIENLKINIKRQYKNELNTESLSNKRKLKHFEVIYDIKTKFVDVCGYDAAKRYLKDVIDMIVDEENYKKKGISVPKGGLLVGPPGTGKTLMARAMAGELESKLKERSKTDVHCAFIPLTGAELASTYDDRIKRLFIDAEGYDYTIIFIDEIDSIGRKRLNNRDYDSLLKLIKEMDGFEKRSGIFILAATNDPDQLDPALKRPGRFDRIIKMDYPNEIERSEIIKYSLEKCHFYDEFLNPYADQKKINETEKKYEELIKAMAGRTYRCTGSDISSYINEALLLFYGNNKICDMAEVKEKEDIYERIIRLDKRDLINLYSYVFLLDEKDQNEFYKLSEQISELKSYTMEDGKEESRSREKYEQMWEGMSKLLQSMAGVNATDRFLNCFIEIVDRKQIGESDGAMPREKFQTQKNTGLSATAVHEVGHAIVYILCGKEEEPFEMLTIIPRGNTLGFVRPGISEGHNLTKKELLDDIKCRMGGRIAEEIVYGAENISVGAVQDIKDATCKALRMVTEFGMSEMGFFEIALSDRNGDPEGYRSSDTMKASAEKSVMKLLSELESEVRGMLKDRKELIKGLAKTAFEKRVMTGKEFMEEYNKLKQP